MSSVVLPCGVTALHIHSPGTFVGSSYQYNLLICNELLLSENKLLLALHTSMAPKWIELSQNWGSNLQEMINFKIKLYCTNGDEIGFFSGKFLGLNPSTQFSHKIMNSGMVKKKEKSLSLKFPFCCAINSWYIPVSPEKLH